MPPSVNVTIFNKHAYKALCLAAAASAWIAAPVFAESEGPEIHGEYLLTGAFHSTSGSGDRTLLHKGAFLTNELKLRMEDDLWDQWKLTGDIHVRKTPDPQIDPRGDFHILGWTTELYNPVLRFTAGDFFGNFSQYTLTQAVKGAQAAYKTDRVEVKGVAAYSRRPDEGKEYMRYVYGGRTEVKAVDKAGPVKDLYIGSNFTGTEDDKTSLTNRGDAHPASNRVGSVNAKMVFNETTDMDIEVAKSWIDRDVRLGGQIFDSQFDRKTGTAVRANTFTRFDRKTKLRLGYEWAGADFETLSGSAIPDRVSFNGRFDRQIDPHWAAQASYRMFYDKLDHSILNERTTTQSPRVALNWTPASETWALKDFYSSFYFEARARQSQDDETGETDFLTNEVGFDSDFKVLDLNFNAGWSFREEDDDFAKENDRLINTGFIGFRTRQKFANMTAMPFIRYQFDYEDLTKLEGRDFMQTLSFGCTLDVSPSMKFEQRYSVGTADRLQYDSDTAKINAYLALDYKLPVPYDMNYRLSYEHTGLDHPSALQRYGEHKLLSQLLWEF